MRGNGAEITTCPRAGCLVQCRGLSSLASHLGYGHNSAKLQERRLKAGPSRVPCVAPGCVYTYATAGSMRRHMRKAHPGRFPVDEVQHYCTNDSCIASFPTEAGLRQHKRHCDSNGTHGGACSSNGEPSEIFSCAVCPKTFSSRAQYLEHRRLHQKYGHVDYKITPADL